MKIIKYTRNVSQGFLEIIMPPTCLSCQDVVDKQGQICGECWQDIHLIGKYKCVKCGLPFEFDLGKNAKCQSCEKTKPKYKKVIAACQHEGTARRLAVNLKFNDRTQLAPYMAAMMVNMGREIVEESDLIIPVPLHKRRKFFRKYNQSAILAREVAKQTSITYDPFLLKRQRATTPQTKLSQKEREENVKDAFVVKQPRHSDRGKADEESFSEKSKRFLVAPLCRNDGIESIEGKNILLIDDVMTTGSTINECTKALKEAGAKTVYGLVFTRVSNPLS